MHPTWSIGVIDVMGNVIRYTVHTYTIQEKHCGEKKASTERCVAASFTGNHMPGADGAWTAGTASDVHARRAVPATVGGPVRTAPGLCGDTGWPPPHAGGQPLYLYVALNQTT